MIFCNFNVFSVHGGDYFRLLTPGEYEITAYQEGYIPKTQQVTVTNPAYEEAQRVDFDLPPLLPVRVLYILFKKKLNILGATIYFCLVYEL